MPQDSMFPDQPDLVGVRLTLEEVASPKGLYWTAGVEVQRRHLDWSTLRLDRYTGIMTDCLPSWADEVVSSFLWGHGPHDTFTAARTAHRVASAHRLTYQANGGRVEF